MTHFLLRHGMALGYTFYTRRNKTVRPQILLRHHFSGKRNIFYVIIMTHSENHNLIVLKKFQCLILQKTLLDTKIKKLNEMGKT